MEMQGTIEWQRSINLVYIKQTIRAIRQLLHGLFIMAGSAKTHPSAAIPDGNFMGWLLNVSADGEVLWQRYGFGDIWKDISVARAQGLIGHIFALSRSYFSVDQKLVT